MNILGLITEAASLGVKPSEQKSTPAHTQSSKSRVKVYGSINHGLKKGYVGQVFSTKNSDRLYVVTKHKWGKKKQQTYSGRTAKGFTNGDYKTVAGYAMRTMSRYGGGSKPKTDRKIQRGQRGQRGRE